MCGPPLLARVHKKGVSLAKCTVFLITKITIFLCLCNTVTRFRRYGYLSHTATQFQLQKSTLMPPVLKIIFAVPQKKFSATATSFRRKWHFHSSPGISIGERSRWPGYRRTNGVHVSKNPLCIRRKKPHY